MFLLIWSVNLKFIHTAITVQTYLSHYSTLTMCVKDRLADRKVFCINLSKQYKNILWFLHEAGLCSTVDLFTRIVDPLFKTPEFWTYNFDFFILVSLSVCRTPEFWTYNFDFFILVSLSVCRAPEFWTYNFDYFILVSLITK